MAAQAWTLDCSDLDQYLGKPLSASPMRDPIANNDIRRWVQAMHYPNLLHYDPAFAEQSRWGRLTAPQSFAIVADDGHGSAPSCVGKIKDSHLLIGGDEWWFYGPPVVAGDTIRVERIPLDYEIKETRFAGPTCFQRGDNHYYNQHGAKIATQRSTMIRYRRGLEADKEGPDEAAEPEWSHEELATLEERKLAWIMTLHDLGHGKRYWDDVQVGDVLPERVFGPHTIASLTTEWRSYLFTIWGSLDRRTDLNLGALGLIDMGGHEKDPVMERINPELTDGAYYGSSRGHLCPRWSRRLGLPRPYGYGASMGAWVTDYLAGWAGEWGSVVHSSADFRGSIFVGDITIQTAEVTGKLIDASGRHLVQVRHRSASQSGTALTSGTAEIELPAKAKAAQTKPR